MQVINFEEAKARRNLREKAVKYIPEVDEGVSELQRRYQEYAQFYNQWYDEHVVGQDKNGAWIYKD